MKIIYRISHVLQMTVNFTCVDGTISVSPNITSYFKTLSNMGNNFDTSYHLLTKSRMQLILHFIENTKVVHLDEFGDVMFDGFLTGFFSRLGDVEVMTLMNIADYYNYQHLFKTCAQEVAKRYQDIKKQEALNKVLNASL